MDEAVENRNYLAKRMTDEIDEMTRYGNSSTQAFSRVFTMA
jgi:hypothetical protein